MDEREFNSMSEELDTTFAIVLNTSMESHDNTMKATENASNTVSAARLAAGTQLCLLNSCRDHW
jgi:hypothetical protein